MMSPGGSSTSWTSSTSSDASPGGRRVRAAATDPLTGRVGVDMTRYRLRRDSVATSDLGSEIVILDLDTSFYFAVSESAAVLVGALAEGASAEELVGRLLDHYDVQAAEAAADVEAFL